MYFNIIFCTSSLLSWSVIDRPSASSCSSAPHPAHDDVLDGLERGPRIFASLAVAVAAVVGAAVLGWCGGWRPTVPGRRSVRIRVDDHRAGRRICGQPRAGGRPPGGRSAVGRKSLARNRCRRRKTVATTREYLLITIAFTFKLPIL